MRNQVSVRKGPELSFIIPEHQSDFEKKVIDVYEKALNQKDLREFHVPHVDIDLFNYLELSDPIHYVAARMMYESRDEHFYENNLSHMSYDAQFQFAIDQMQTFQDDIDHRPRMLYDELFYHDITAVLNFNKICFVDLGKMSDIGSFWIQGDFYKNLPWSRQVW